MFLNMKMKMVLMFKSWELVEEHLVEFLKDEVSKTGLKKVVLGLSGGLDSAVVAVLLKKAFGDNLLAVMMPTHLSSESSLKDAKELIDKFSIKSETVNIGDYLQLFSEKSRNSSDLRKGNFSARLRMVTLYDISARDGSLVIGTSNKSEILLGYGTIFGDLASAVNPIGDIYKSDLFSFARYLGVPSSIIEKPPSADLFEGQSDENEIGYSYKDIDRVFKLYVDDRYSVEKIVSMGENEKFVRDIIGRIYKNQFKRKMPIVAKLSHRTFGHDFLYARDVKF